MINPTVYLGYIEPLLDGRWYFTYYKNGRMHTSFHSYATRELARAALRALFN